MSFASIYAPPGYTGPSYWQGNNLVRMNPWGAAPGQGGLPPSALGQGGMGGNPLIGGGVPSYWTSPFANPSWGRGTSESSGEDAHASGIPGNEWSPAGAAGQPTQNPPNWGSLSMLSGKPAVLAGLIGAGLGIPGIGLGMQAIGSTGNVIKGNSWLEGYGLPRTLDFGSGLSDFGYHSTFGLLGRPAMSTAADQIFGGPGSGKPAELDTFNPSPGAIPPQMQVAQDALAQAQLGGAVSVPPAMAQWILENAMAGAPNTPDPYFDQLSQPDVSGTYNPYAYDYGGAYSSGDTPGWY